MDNDNKELIFFPLNNYKYKKNIKFYFNNEQQDYDDNELIPSVCPYCNCFNGKNKNSINKYIFIYECDVCDLKYFLENNIIKDIYFDDIESYYLYLTEENKINIGIYYAIELWLRYKTINYMDILENIPINNFERIEYGKDPFKSINNIVPIEYRSGNIKIGFCKIKNLF